jgi:hypothetical protein
MEYAVEMASGAAPRPTQPPVQWIARALSSGLKRPGHKTAHSPPSSAKVKNGGAIRPLLPTS